MTLIIYLISSFTFSALCLRVFDHFSTLFWQTNILTKSVERNIKDLPDLFNVFCSQLYVEIPLFKAFWQFFDNFLTDRPKDRQTDQDTQSYKLRARSLKTRTLMFPFYFGAKSFVRIKPILQRLGRYFRLSEIVIGLRFII